MKAVAEPCAWFFKCALYFEETYSPARLVMTLLLVHSPGLASVIPPKNELCYLDDCRHTRIPLSHCMGRQGR